MFDFDLERILLTIPGILIGLAFHEFAHAFASDRLGDPTPRQQGRLTLSPLPHIDPIGFILIALLGFGWAKPVQINPRYYKKPRRDDILVSIAGPFTNLLLAAAFAALLKLFVVSGLLGNFSQDVNINIIKLFYYTISINVVLFLFNLIPIPPLDGYHVLANVIPARNYRFLHMMEQYGFILLILLIVSDATRYIIGYPAEYITSFIQNLFGVGLNNILQIFI